MYVQCFKCIKKYKVNAAAIPVGGAVVSCKGCGEKLRLEPRDNAAADATKIPVNKRKHKKELKWYGRSVDMIKEWGYEKGHTEFNMLFYWLREFRKRFGITFFDITCNAHMALIDRELMYNRLAFMGNCCVPPQEGDFESCIPGLLGGMAEVLRAKDSAGRYAVENIMRMANPDSFPALIRFGYGTSFEASYGETVYGNAVQVDISLDKVRELPENYDALDLATYARIEVSRVPIETGRLTFKQITAPGLHVHPDPDPDLRCTDPQVAKIVERFA